MRSYEDGIYMDGASFTVGVNAYICQEPEITVYSATSSHVYNDLNGACVPQGVRFSLFTFFPCLIYLHLIGNRLLLNGRSIVVGDPSQLRPDSRVFTLRALNLHWSGLVPLTVLWLFWPMRHRSSALR